MANADGTDIFEIMSRGEVMNMFSNLATPENISNINAQLASIMIDVGSYKTNANTWGQALQAAINYAGSIYSSQSELGNVYAAQNVLVKMPRGRYVLTETITGVKGIDFDFSGSTFVASPSDNSLTFLDFTDKIFRSYWRKGTFVGYKTAVIASTANVDTSNFVWDSPTFQSCSVGIDTISYSDSRSTFIQLKNVYSIKTDCLIKTHSDLTQIDGGWIYHTGYNGAAIYNQGFTKITNLICVPAAAQSGARPRWIDNYSEDAGSTTILGQRGLFIDHCRFGGETGSMPIVFNYATNDQDLTVYQGTIIDIQNSIMSSAGTSDLANIILFALPNRISIKNCTGFTNLTNGVIHCDSTFNSTTVANSRYISIEVDNTSYASPSFPLIDSDLYRFLKTKENLNTQFRSTFTSGKTHLRYTPVSAGTDAGTSRPLSKITVNVSTPTIDNTTYGTDYGIGFFVIINAFDSASGTYAYKSQSLYYVGTSGGYNSGKVKILNFTSLAQYAGGSSNSTTTAITSVLWSTTQANQVPIANNENIDVVFFGNPSYSRVTIVPVFGLTSDVS